MSIFGENRVSLNIGTDGPCVILDVLKPAKSRTALVYCNTLLDTLPSTLMTVYLTVDYLADSLAASLASCLSSKSIPSRISE